MIRGRLLSVRVLSRVCACVFCLFVSLLVYRSLRTTDSGNDTSRSVRHTSLLLNHTTLKPANTTNASFNCSCTEQDAFAWRQSNSTCTGFREHRGGSQDVVSMSFFGEFTSRYLVGVERNADAVGRFYPGWRMRVYVDGNKWREDVSLMKFRCQMMCRYKFIEFCDVTNVRGYGDISRYFGTVWRFLPLGDSSVRRFIVRDVDALIIQRDRDAVDDWISSGLPFHVIRDHPFHGAVMLAGLWGALNNNLALYKSIAQNIIYRARTHIKGEDQYLLATILWPYILRTRQVLSHDSYLCHIYPRTSPFPTRRLSPNEVLGTDMSDATRLKKKCPIQCRPHNHPDWNYC